MNIGILFSGRGSNLQNIIFSRNYPSLTITSIITDNSHADGIEYPLNNGFSVTILPYRRSVKSVFDWECQITDILEDNAVDLVVLAGFMRVLHEDFCQHWKGRCINIHPSLLPMYPGLDTHRRVIEAKESWHGCSIHYVDSVVDAGPIIAQIPIKVYPEDTEDSLKNRVLRYEHKLYPQVIRAICEREIIYNTQNDIISYKGKLISTSKCCDHVIDPQSVAKSLLFMGD